MNIKKIEFVMKKKSPQKASPGPDNFTDNSTKC